MNDEEIQGVREVVEPSEVTALPPFSEILPTGVTLYHGRRSDKEDINQWPLPTSSTGSLGKGLYVSKDFDFVNDIYAKNESGARVYKLTPKKDLHLIPSSISHDKAILLADYLGETLYSEDLYSRSELLRLMQYGDVVQLNAILNFLQSIEGFEPSQEHLHEDLAVFRASVLKKVGYDGVEDGKTIVIFDPSKLETQY